MAQLYKIAIDTNMLLYITAHRVDVFGEIRKMFPKVEFIIPQSVAYELERIGKSNKTKAKQVNVATKLMELNDVKVMPLSGNADRDLMELAKQGIIVATNDKELKKLIKGFGGKVIYLRKKKLLEVV